MNWSWRPDHLADAASGRGRGGARRRFLGAFSGVVAAHLLLLASLALAPARFAPMASAPSVMVELAAASTLAQAVPAPRAVPATAPPTPSPSPPPSPPPQPSLQPDPPPPAPVSDLKALERELPPVDPTAEPTPLTPQAPAPQPAAPGATVGPTASATSCDLSGAIQAALEGDPKTRDELALIPRQARSVANAVQLWDGVWVDPDSLGGPAITEPIRVAIVNTISQAPPACSDQTVVGPRLFAVADPRGTIIVALGSGQWKWSDLLAPAPTPFAFLDALLNR